MGYRPCSPGSLECPRPRQRFSPPQPAVPRSNRNSRARLNPVEDLCTLTLASILPEEMAAVVPYLITTRGLRRDSLNIPPQTLVLYLYTRHGQLKDRRLRRSYSKQPYACRCIHHDYSKSPIMEQDYKRAQTLCKGCFVSHLWQVHPRHSLS